MVHEAKLITVSLALAPQRSEFLHLCSKSSCRDASQWVIKVMLKLLLITTATTALDHYARTVPAVVDRVRAAQVTADACDTFVPCAAPVLADAADADAALASLRTHGYAIVESPGLAERWLEGAQALTADDQLRGVWGSTAVAGRPDTLYGGYGGRTAVYVDTCVEINQ